MITSTTSVKTGLVLLCAWVGVCLLACSPRPASGPISLPQARQLAQPEAQPTLPPAAAPTGQPQAQPQQLPQPEAQPVLSPSATPAGQPQPTRLQQSQVELVLPPALMPGQPQASPTQRAQPGVEPTLPPPRPPTGQPQAPPQLQPPVPQRPAPAAISLPGIWESQTMTGYGVIYSQMILQPNNSYSYQVVLGDLVTWETGIYEAGEGFVHFSVLDYEPKVYKGTVMSRPTSWTVFYTVVDENTMIWEDRVLGTQWTVHRRR